MVVMGKSDAGKSTIANYLIGHDPLSHSDRPFEVSTKVLSESVTPEVKFEATEFTRENVLYRVTVIDTVGLFGNCIADQDSIFDKIETFFKDSIDGINLILFVFKKGRFTAEERDTFSYIRNRFDPDISHISALAVTHCENDSPRAREDLIKEFQANEYTKPIADEMKMGIYPVGFPPLNTYEPQHQAIYKRQMEQDKKALEDLIVKAGRVHLTRKLFVKKTTGCTCAIL